MKAILCKRWAVKWHGHFHFDGAFSSEWFALDSFVFGSRPLLFTTRAKARTYIDEKWGYIRTRTDLRQPPHNWRMPVAVRVQVIFRETVKGKR